MVETRRWDACKLRRSEVGGERSPSWSHETRHCDFLRVRTGVFGGRPAGVTDGLWREPMHHDLHVWIPRVSGECPDCLHHRTPQYWLHRLASSAANQLSRSAASSLAALMLTFDNNVEWINQRSMWIWTHVSRQTRSHRFRTPANVKSEVTVLRNPASVFIFATHSSVWFKGEVCSYLRNTREGLPHIISRVAELQR